MAKYRRKPIIVKAEQWFNGKKINGVCDCAMKEFGRGFHVHTLEGTLTVSEGDWIITGITGEKYPCRPDIFDKIYELVEE